MVTYLSVELVDIAGAQGRLRSTILLDCCIIFYKATLYPFSHTCSDSLSFLTCFIGLRMHSSRLLYSGVYQVGELFLLG